ncbi:MAG: sigma-70 family RNA polymerase sigma factor [Bacteroidia bacterium]
MAPPPDIEQTIVAYLQQQDKRAIELIFRYYKTALYGVILKILEDEQWAEDALQESLVKIWRNGGSYDRTKGRLFTWLLNICRNTAIDKRRSKPFQVARQIQSQPEGVGMPDDKQSHETPTDSIGVREMVQTLAPEQRVLLDLVYFQGYTHQEASDHLDIPLGTVKTRIRTAVQALRKWVNS